MESPRYEFKPGLEILISRRYTSFVVAVVPETQPDSTVLNLILYKDWNPYRERWDYHVSDENSLNWEMDLYKREFEKSGSFRQALNKKSLKMFEAECVENPEGRKVTLDDNYLKEMFSNYKIKD